MSGQLIGGIVGAAIGMFTPMGPAWGWMIGSTLGALAFPPAGPDGPRLSDLSPQASEYGRPIPLVFGTVGVAGNVIWASDLVEVQGEAGGGKGGGGATVYSYFANFAVALCEGEVTLGRIWAGPEKRLIWDGAILEGADAGAVLRFYPGRDDQLPDPLIESYLGVGNVPAYRGTAYLVLEHFPLKKDGNRIPFLTVEVGALASSAPTNLGVVWISQVIVTSTYYAAFYWGSYYGVVIRHLDDNTLFAHYTYPGSQWDVNATWEYDPDREAFIRCNALRTYTTLALSNGAMTDHVIAEATLTDGNPGNNTAYCVYHNGAYIFGGYNSPGNAQRVTLYVVDPDTHAPLATYVSDTDAGTFRGPLLAPLAGEAWVCGYSYPQRLSRFALSLGSTPADLGAPAPTALSYVAANMVVDPNTGFIWSASFDGGNLEVHCNDPATGLIYSETIATSFWTLAGRPFTFTPGQVIITGDKWLATDCFQTFVADPPSYVGESVGGYHGTANINVLAYNPVTLDLMAFRDGGTICFGDPSDPASVNFLQPGSFNQEPDNKYLGEADGTTHPQGQPLSEIVTILSERAGLEALQIDVTQLTDMVDGYALARQTTVRAAIDTLRPAYYFDAVESSGVVKFVKRGGAIAAVIPDDDLAAHEAGQSTSDALLTTRQMEVELPRTLNVNYLLQATDYSSATKVTQRLVGSSESEQTLELPLVLTDTKAQQVAEVNLHVAWVQRLAYSFSLPKKYAWLEPTDCVVVKGYPMRLGKISASPDGVLKCEALADDANYYVPNVVVTETPDSGKLVYVPGATRLELM
ncbi:phage tail protein [Ramlibacter sp. AW1]|uniref:Phage tail protein n=1 Tax=Ramlibacter aurantiacus TaxID=2801330 RepID=A0A937D0S2_9BURK|nr:phage tail protein [Ramlibacter aurantiacus]